MIRPLFGVLAAAGVATGCAHFATERVPRPAGVRHSAALAPHVAACPSQGTAGVAGQTAVFGDLRLPCLVPGPAVRLGELGGGRPVLVNLWASWCIPCQREMPLLERAHDIAGHRVLFLGVDTLDDPDSARSFLVAASVTYPQLVDSAGTVRSHVRAVGLPVTVVVRADGTVAYRRLGQVGADDLANALTAVGVRLTAERLKSEP